MGTQGERKQEQPKKFFQKVAELIDSVSPKEKNADIESDQDVS